MPKIMEITDLQIGDYVALKVNPINPYKVVGLNFNEYKEKQILYIQSLATGAVIETDNESLVGIKLTKDILKKNKWANDLYSILPIDENKYLQYYYFSKRLHNV